MRERSVINGSSSTTGIILEVGVGTFVVVSVGKGFSGGDHGSAFRGLHSVVFRCFPYLDGCHFPVVMPTGRSI
jgi:hypothetical protein